MCLERLGPPLAACPALAGRRLRFEEVGERIGERAAVIARNRAVVAGDPGGDEGSPLPRRAETGVGDPLGELELIDAAQGLDQDPHQHPVAAEIHQRTVGGGARSQGPLFGADAVARNAPGRGRRFVGLAKPAIVNGGAGIMLAAGDHVIGVAGITVAGGRIAEIDLITDQTKLRGTQA